MPRSWPLAALVLGFPLWWVLGLTAVMPMVLAVPMAVQLLRAPTVRLPRGFGWWLLFLVWVAVGVLVLWADAPGAVGGGGATRLLVFGYRFGWYLTCTVVLLWIGNSDRRDLPDATVIRLAGAFFVVCTAGGLLGVLAPELEFRSAVEHLLPGGLRANAFVSSLVHPETADVQTVLGRPEARPKAPFAFTNSWGSALALSLVFFVAALCTAPRPWAIAGVGVVALAAIPVGFSLNRGLWACLALGGVGLLVHQVLRGRRSHAAVLTGAGVLALVLLATSPLGALFTERLDNQHSNDRRGQLLTATVDATTTGSPVVGFGNTRDVQGSFTSIAGGSTPDCPACGVPPLGTQGHLWLVIFSQGWFGAAFFLVFFALALVRSAACRTVVDTICVFVLGFFAVQLSIYDTLGVPLLLVMTAIGLAWRAHGSATGPRALSTATRMAAEVRRGLPITAVLVLTGAGLGGYVALRAVPEHTARVAIALTPTPVYLDTGPAATAAGLDRVTPAPREITVDTEAALLLSDGTLGPVSGSRGAAAVRRTIELTAPPLSQVLEVTLVDTDPARVARTARAVAESYLAARREHLEQRRRDLVVQLHEEERAVDRSDPSTERTRTYLTSALHHLATTSPTAGEVIRRGPARARRVQVEVPVASGAALGLLTGTALGALRRRKP